MIGLSQKQAAALLAENGPNLIFQPTRFSVLGGFLLRFKNPLLLVLLFSAILSGFLGDITSAVIIVIIVLISVILDFVNTAKSEHAAALLKDKVTISTAVYRDGKLIELPVYQIVVGDIIELKAGDIIPADGTIIASQDCYVNQSALNGESYPKAKRVNDEVSMGTSLVSGTATIKIILTGNQTKFSHIAEAVAKNPRTTEFDREIHNFSYVIVRITFILVAFIFVFNLFFKHSMLESLLFSLALAVGLTPELLPMIITLNLTKGSLAMAKHGVIIKKLSAIQNFGSMDVLCTDKTGTLTEDRITLVKYLDVKGHESMAVLETAYLSSSLGQSFKGPMDRAIASFKHLSLTNKGYKKVDEMPFDFERKRDSIVLSHKISSGKIEYVMIAKGAPEEILAVCSHYQTKKVPLNATHKKQAETLFKKLSQGGYRVLAVATKSISKKADYTHDDETGMVFFGYMAFLDPAKKDVMSTLNKMSEYGIEVKVITGDNDLVTRKIAHDIGLSIKGLMLGSEIASSSDKELLLKIDKTTIFARVNPEQKMRIIQLLQKKGHVVGYLGDGINDAPSLKVADVGISVNNAVDVAKDSADIILLHKSLYNLIEGVLEGRKTFANTLKYLKMSLSSNFGNMISMAGASIYLPFLPMLPTQILLNNLLYDSSQLAIPVDRIDEIELKNPRKLEMKSLKRFMWLFGGLSSAFDLLTFFLLYKLFGFGASAFQTGWFLESIATQTLVVYIVRTRLVPFVESWPSNSLLVSTLLVIAIALVIIFSNLGSFFGFSLLGGLPLLVIGLVVLVYLVAVQLLKSRLSRYVGL